MTDFLNIVVGPPANGAVTSGQAVSARAGNEGDMITSQLHGELFEQTFRQNRFGACMQAVLATALSTALTATYTGGLVLINPNGSGVNVSLQKAMLADIIAQTSVSAVGIGVGFSTTAVTATTPTNLARNKFLGGRVGQALAWSMASVTLPVAMTLDTILATFSEGVITSDPGVMPGYFDLKGGIILPPGGYAAFVASAGLIASSYMLGFEWEEVPLTA